MLATLIIGQTDLQRVSPPDPWHAIHGVADYDQAIGLDLDHAAAYLGRCHAKSKLGRYEEAGEDYDHAVHLNPASASGDG